MIFQRIETGALPAHDFKRKYVDYCINLNKANEKNKERRRKGSVNKSNNKNGFCCN